MKKPLIFIASILLAMGTAHATPSKLMHIPSTDVQPYGTFHMAIENNTTMFRQKDIGGHAEPMNFGISAGLRDGGTYQVEAGVDVREPYDYPLTFHAKLATTEEAFGKWGPILAVGAYDVSAEKGKNDVNIMYGEASKTVSFIGRFTVGYFYGNSDFLKNSAGDTDNHGLMLGFDRRMPEVNQKLWFGIDYMAGRSYYGAVTFGFGWSFSEKATLVIGYVRYNEEAVAKGWPPNSAAASPGPGANVMTLQAHFDF